MLANAESQQSPSRNFAPTRPITTEMARRPYSEPYKEARAGSKEDSELEICLPDGDAISAAYAYKTGGAFSKEGAVCACLDWVIIIIEGRHLEELATLLAHHNAKWIQVKHKPPDGGKVPESSPYIERVRFYQRDLWPKLLLEVIGVEINEKLEGEGV